MAFDIQFKLIYQGIRDVFRVRSLSYNPEYGETDTRRYPTKVTIDEGNYGNQGNGKVYPSTTGHVGPGSDGSGMTIYPGSY